MKDQIKALEDIIKGQEETLGKEVEQLNISKKSLLTKKILLKQMSKKANHVPFFRTKVGKFGLKTLRMVTHPFAHLNNNADLAIESPVIYQGKDLMEQFMSGPTFI